MTIADKKVVTMQYTVKNSQGEVLDSSEQAGSPLVYLHGAQNVVPGLEAALNGKQAGDKMEVTLEPAEAYGERMDELIQEVPRSAFEGIAEKELTIGMRFNATTDSGHPLPVVIVEVSEENVTVDGNHPLAGVALSFDVEIEDVRDATEEEISHGHVHSAEGCGH
ncbi:MAG: peptidylprolyl isomerase [Cellvibrionaceae bacterium]